jgi:hypothetical protein
VSAGGELMAKYYPELIAARWALSQAPASPTLREKLRVAKVNICCATLEQQFKKLAEDPQVQQHLREIAAIIDAAQRLNAKVPMDWLLVQMAGISLSVVEMDASSFLRTFNAESDPEPERRQII